MEQKVFEQKLTEKNTKIGGLFPYLGNFEFDYDDLKVDGTVYFTITPDENSWGWDGVRIKVRDIELDITWTVCSPDELTPEEKENLIKIGGVEYINDTIEGKFSLYSGDGKWKIDEDVVIAKDGTIMINQVEIDLSPNRDENISALVL